MTRYEHAGAASVTTLTGAVTDAATVFTVLDATGWPTGSVGPFWCTVDAGGDEERVLCASRSGNTLNVQTRGADGTTPKAHSANVTVAHTYSATEADEASSHINQTTGTVHGLVLANLLDTSDLNPANVVLLSGTQTLTGKTLAAGTVVQSPTITGTPVATAADLSSFGGAWSTWTPTLTNYTASATTARYHRLGKKITATFKATLATAGAGSTHYTSLPVPPNTSLYNVCIGSALAFISPSFYTAVCGFDANGVYVVSNGTTAWNNTSPAAWAVGASLHWTITYEAA